MISEECDAIEDFAETDELVGFDLKCGQSGFQNLKF